MENHVERQHQNRHLPLQAPPHHQTQLRNLYRPRLHRRHSSLPQGKLRMPLLLSFSEEWSPSSRLVRPSRNGCLTTSPISTGSIVPGIPRILTRTISTQVWCGGHPRSNWTTTASWSSNLPDSARRAQKTKINRCFKNPWHRGLGKLCSDDKTNAMKTPDCAGTRHPDGLSPFQFSDFQFFQSPLPPSTPSTPFSPTSSLRQGYGRQAGPAHRLFHGLSSKSKFLAATP